MQLADDFVETAVNSACLFAKHRKSNTIDVKDVQLHLGESLYHSRMIVLYQFNNFENIVASTNVTVVLLQMGHFLLFTERNWNMWIPGFGTDELRPFKRASMTEAHKQRLALIRKALKKY